MSQNTGRTLLRLSSCCNQNIVDPANSTERELQGEKEKVLRSQERSWNFWRRWFLFLLKGHCYYYHLTL
ncbi:hypothetical protein MUG91_G291n12 [Manis pentadactyla]|nr:hypothetical protein MUG91_G291n12 [Manis pentadactyla]